MGNFFATAPVELRGSLLAGIRRIAKTWTKYHADAERAGFPVAGTNRGYVSEAAVSPEQAASKQLALAISKGRYIRSYVLYSAGGLIQDITATLQKHEEEGGGSLTLDDDVYTKNIVGVVQVNAHKRGTQWNASEISGTAAQKGYGPLLYDIAMAAEGGLVPDRDKVSSTAKEVWKQYRTARPDVEAKPLDDEKHPKTHTKLDDTHKMHPGGEENPLNYAYFISKAPNIAALLNNDKVFKKQALEQLKDLGYNENKLDLDFQSAADGYFRGAYTG
jgi:hypothetical protein